MLEENDIVTIKRNGMKYSGWLSVEIESSVEQKARSFKLGITQKCPGNLVELKMDYHDAIEVFIGNDKVLSGFVDSVPVTYNATSISVHVLGRSKTRDIIDSSVNQQQNSSWRNVKAIDIIKDLSAAQSVDVKEQGSSGSDKVELHAVNPGETIAASIDRIARAKGKLMTDDEEGNLIICKPGSAGTADDSLESGVNILSCSYKNDGSNVYGTIIVSGQTAGSDDQFGAASAQVTGEATNSNAPVNRIKIVSSEGRTNTEAQKERAQALQNYLLGKSREITYEVQGWRQSSGKLWKHNQFVMVKDSILHINTQLLIKKVKYVLDSKGKRTTLVLVHESTFSKKKTDGKNTVNWNVKAIE